MTNKLLDIPGDSANHKKLILREKRGKITNRPELESLLEKEINQVLLTQKNELTLANKTQIANQFTPEIEKLQKKVAEKYGYTVFTVIVENRHGGKNVHGVPDDKLEAFKFDIVLLDPLIVLLVNVSLTLLNL